jgi:hypothetical protein
MLPWGQVHFLGVQVDRRRRLGAPVTLRLIEIKNGDTVLAKDAFEHNAGIGVFGCVMSHISL